MDSKRIFEERNKLYENIDKDLMNSSNQRIQNKLFLRKQKVNDIIQKKRLLGYNSAINNNEITSKWKLLYNLSKLEFPKDSGEKYNLDFNDDEEMLSTSLKYINSEEIIDVKYSIVLIQMFVTKHTNNELSNYINLMFISDLFRLIEKFQKNKEIIFNILYILIHYSYATDDKNLSTILLSPKAYKIWELCFNLQDYDILYGMICVLNNIILDNQIGGCNLIRSTLVLINLYHFFENQTIISQMNINDKKSVMYDIINNGVSLFCNLLVVSMDRLDRLTSEEIYTCKQKIINIVIIYSDINNFESYQNCIYSIYSSVLKEMRLFDELEKSNFIQNLLNKKKFFEVLKIRFYVNKIFGNFIAYKNKIDHSLLVEILNFEIEYLNICNVGSYRKEIFWALSNMLILDGTISNEICNNEEFIKKITYCYNYSFNYSEINELSYFFTLILYKININNFMKIQKYKLFEIAIEHAKNTLENNLEGLILVFRLLEVIFEFGKCMMKYYDGRNIVLDKFNALGGKELLDKYLNFQNDNLCELLNKIMEEFY